MKAVTTPAPAEVLNLELIFPYHTDLVLDSSVPTDPSAMVKSTESLYARGSPDETQSAVVGSPRYFVLGVMPSRLLKSNVLD